MSKMKDFEHYLGIANHDIQMANNHNALKSYVASLLYNYDDLVEENENLKKQLEERHNEIKALRASLQSTTSEIVNLETRQKGFVKYLENEKDRVIKECSHHYIDSFDRLHSVNEDIFDEINEILSKYKEIIGEAGEDE